jgi:hypothetical protein
VPSRGGGRGRLQMDGSACGLRMNGSARRLRVDGCVYADGNRDNGRKKVPRAEFSA